MLKSFIKIAFRCLWQKKTYTLLNFLCLTFGLTCAIITLLFIRNVFSYDKFHKNYNRLYSVEAWVTYFNGDRFPKEYLSSSLTELLKEHVPEADDMIRVAQYDCEFVNEDKTFSGKGFYADSNFFSIFSFPLIQPDNVAFLNDPFSIAISESMARKFFKNTDCTGKSLIMKDGSREESFNITGVFRDIPSQSLLQFDFVIPFSKFLADNKWALEPGATSNETWILLKDKTDKSIIDSKIRDLIKNQETTLNQELFLFPLKEKILYSYAGGKRVWNEMQNIVIAGSIGFAILLIACFNFINLSIALNFRRYREAGIKKVSGAAKSTIIAQFLGETYIMTTISLLSALILVRVLLIGVNRLLNFDIQFTPDLILILILVGITMITGLLSGLLPAFYMASSKPADALKGRILTSHSYSFLRQSLIVFQFTIPVVLIICMMIIKSQDSYMRNYDIGVDKDKTIILSNTPEIQKHSASIKAEINAIPGIDAVSFTNCIPGRGARITSEVIWEGKDLAEKLHFWCITSDFDYNKTVSINIVNGRFFNPSYSTDSVSFLINDVAAGVMKKSSPVGSSITIDGQKGTIIGLFKDFHAIDLAGPKVPAVIRISKEEQPYILIRYSNGSFESITEKILAVYRSYESEKPFQATLFRDLNDFSDLNLPSKLVGIAFIIALLLACMGLFGLASFTSENRTKEIGIRKANGATTLSVMLLLLKKYSKWLTISVMIALPISFLLGKIFLGKFYFHVPMPLWAFIAGPMIAVLVAILTVSSQTWNAANRNPIKSLRYE